MTKRIHLLAIVAVLVGWVGVSEAAAPPCPTPDGAGNEGNPGVPMSCWDYTAWVSQAQVDQIHDAFVAAGGVTAAANVGTSYGSQTSRQDIVDQITTLMRARMFQGNRAAIRAQWAALFAMNNATWLSRIGAANNAANIRKMAGVWLPINQAKLTAASTARDNALAAWQADQTAAKAQAYWDAERVKLAFEEMVGATQDAMQ